MAWLACASPTSVVVQAPVAVATAPAAMRENPIGTLEDAQADLLGTRYSRAETVFRRLAPDSAQAQLGLAELLLQTGRASQCAVLLKALLSSLQFEVKARTLTARCLRQSGKWADSRRVLLPIQHRPSAHYARLLLGELLLRRGERQAASEQFMSLIEDYNSDRITEEDGSSLALVGRAAHLLRSPQDANDAFNAAERASPLEPNLLLWRAELFLEKHDAGQAQEVLKQLLDKAPNRAEALVLLAETTLEGAMDFGAAQQLAKTALQVNAGEAKAHYVLAGIELRNLAFSAAHREVESGLALQPNCLELLSMKAAIAFLQGNTAVFEKVRAQVFSVNPGYSKFFSIVGKYAEWEHRYASIVKMMRVAVQLDPQDAAAHAALGFNLIRAGEEREGVEQLRQAFAEDGFDLRVFNTLNLYEKTIPAHYESELVGHFLIRYPKKEKALLERYVPSWLEAGWDRLSSLYEFSPRLPIGVELYTEKEHFAVRTSGLPQTAIAGVCFGQTLATLTPRHESFNLGMTLWHELSHVFHIQMSNSHVPRWLTEGLAEHETRQERHEWSRHLDLQLYRAIRAGQLPQVLQMNDAFTRAESLSEIAVAYFASNQAASWIVQKKGRGAVRQLLREFPKGGVTAEVLTGILAAGRAGQIELQYREFLSQQLARYETQFVPIHVTGTLAELAAKARVSPQSISSLVSLGAVALRDHDLPVASAALKRALALNSSNPDVRFLRAKLSAALDEPQLALAELRAMVGADHNGYAVQMALADIFRVVGPVDQEHAALRESHRLDPSQSGPLMRLWLLAKSDSNWLDEIRWLELLADLEPHQGAIVQRLQTLLLSTGRYKAAAERGKQALYVDLENPRVHTLYARALSALGRDRHAEFEFESALLCPTTPAELARAHHHYASYLRSRGLSGRAREQDMRAKLSENK